jgi:hypothetical protein
VFESRLDGAFWGGIFGVSGYFNQEKSYLILDNSLVGDIFFDGISDLSLSIFERV